MAKDPAVLFYTQDFLVGTLTMTDEQRGKYIYLLCLQHQKGKLTLTDLKSKLTDEDIDVANRFPLQPDGFYYNQRMYDESVKRKNYTESRRNNRKKKDDVDILHISKSYVNRMENANANENVNKDINEYTSADINIALKQLDNLTEYIDDNNIPAAKKLLKSITEDYGGFENVLQLCYGDDSSVLRKWQRYYYNALQFIE